MGLVAVTLDPQLQNISIITERLVGYRWYSQNFLGSPTRLRGLASANPCSFFLHHPPIHLPDPALLADKLPPRTGPLHRLFPQLGAFFSVILD